MKNIKDALIDMGIAETEAKQLIEECRADLNKRIKAGESIDTLLNICNDWFGIDPDYITNII